jgi:hypothetical protein
VTDDGENYIQSSHNIYYSFSITLVIKAQRMSKLGHMAHTGNEGLHYEDG